MDVISSNQAAVGILVSTVQKSSHVMVETQGNWVISEDPMTPEPIKPEVSKPITEQSSSQSIGQPIRSQNIVMISNSRPISSGTADGRPSMVVVNDDSRPVRGDLPTRRPGN